MTEQKRVLYERFDWLNEMSTLLVEGEQKQPKTLKSAQRLLSRKEHLQSWMIFQTSLSHVERKHGRKTKCFFNFY